MGDKDIVTKDILKNIAYELSKYILKIPISKKIELIDKEFVRVEKKEADLIFKSNKDIIHIEIQNDNHKKMDKRMLRYYSDILFDYEEYNIKQYIIYIGRYKCSMKSKIQRDSIDYQYKIIDMKDIPCQEFLESNDPSAVSLAILCDFKDENRQEIVNKILFKLKDISQDDIEFKSHLKIVEILSTNRNLEAEIKKGEEMLIVDVEKMPSYSLGMEKGLLKGKDKWLSQGVISTAITMINKFKLSAEEVAKELNISIDELKKHLNK